MAHLTPLAVELNPDSEVLRQSALAHLRAQRIVSPSTGRLQQPLLVVRSSLAELKDNAGSVKVDTVLDELQKLKELRSLNLPEPLFQDIPPKVVTQHRRRAASEPPRELRRHPETVRCALLAALCWQRQVEVTDNLVELLIHIAHHIGARAESRVESELPRQLRKVSRRKKRGVAARVGPPRPDADRGIGGDIPLWTEVQTAYGWIHRAADILTNEDGHSEEDVRAAYAVLLTEMAQRCDTVGLLATAVDHFLKVTISYAPGLFHCYVVPDLPRTNNDLERFFGKARHNERRVTGRKLASPGLVVWGAVRVVAAVATQLRSFSAADLHPSDLARWTAVRRALEYRHEARRAQLRFRRDPTAYLTLIEQGLLHEGLPS